MSPSAAPAVGFPSLRSLFEETEKLHAPNSQISITLFTAIGRRKPIEGERKEREQKKERRRKNERDNRKRQRGSGRERENCVGVAREEASPLSVSLSVIG